MARPPKPVDKLAQKEEKWGACRDTVGRKIVTNVEAA